MLLKCLSSVVYEYATHLGSSTTTDFEAVGVTLSGFIAAELAVNACVTLPAAISYCNSLFVTTTLRNVTFQLVALLLSTPPPCSGDWIAQSLQ